MLIELRIRDYAVIARATVRLGPGLNVLTGETGAGKSIIVGALSLLLGERASADVIRAGAARASVEGVFDVSAQPGVLDLLDEQGLEPEDGLLVLRREVAAEGRNRAWINGAAATAGLVGELGRLLVDLHGQHEHQTLLRVDEQRGLLDAFADAGATATRLRAAHDCLRLLEADLHELEVRLRDAAQRSDFLAFQVSEIGEAVVRAGEEDELEAEARRLRHAEDIANAAARLHQELYVADESIAARLDALRRVAARLTEMDPDQYEVGEQIESAYYALQELGRQMGDYAANIEHEPHRLDAIRRRQDLLFRLKSKYGPTLEDVIETERRAREELAELEGADLQKLDLERRRESARMELQGAASALSAKRSAAAERLCAEVMALLPDLGLAGGRFEIALMRRQAVAATGAENVEFRIALNEGFDLRPLARVASGGELSRVMLALKTVLARLDRVPSLVFDEIDVGIGGLVAHRVAEKLQQVARDHQVFVITHLAQIAARADHHLLVEKAEAEGRVTTGVERLDGEARVSEIARMLGADAAAGAGLDHAREMLGGAAASGAQR